MPTARLIDVNTAAIVYRTKVLMALDKRQYDSCIGAIKSMNSLLPADTDDKKYRIVFDTDEYNSVVKDSYLIECPKCKKEFPRNTIKIYDIDLREQERIILGVKTKKIWVCPKCKKEINLKDTKTIKTSLQSPYYHRVLPEPPSVDVGLLSQITFHSKMKRWIWMCLNSLEDGYTRFRDDNWNRHDEQFDDSSIDTSFEENAND